MEMTPTDGSVQPAAINGVCMSHMQTIVYVKDDRFGCLVCHLQARVDNVNAIANDWVKVAAERQREIDNLKERAAKAEAALNAGANDYSKAWLDGANWKEETVRLIEERTKERDAAMSQLEQRGAEFQRLLRERDAAVRDRNKALCEEDLDRLERVTKERDAAKRDYARVVDSREGYVARLEKAESDLARLRFENEALFSIAVEATHDGSCERGGSHRRGTEDFNEHLRVANDGVKRKLRAALAGAPKPGRRALDEQIRQDNGLPAKPASGPCGECCDRNHRMCTGYGSCPCCPKPPAPEPCTHTAHLEPNGGTRMGLLVALNGVALWVHCKGAK